VILYSQQHGYLGCLIQLDTERLRALDPGADAAAAAAGLTGIDEGRRGRGPAGQSPGARFRWLTAPRSTIVQPGPVHSGLTADPAAELTHLFDTLVRTTPLPARCPGPPSPLTRPLPLAPLPASSPPFAYIHFDHIVH